MAVGPFAFSICLAVRGHHVEGFVPADRREFAILGVDAVPLAQQRRRQPVAAVHDLGEEIALDAVEAAIDLGQRVAVGGDHFAFLHADHDAATRAAKTAGRFRPLDFQRPNSTLNRLCHRGYGDIGDASGDGGGVRLQHVAA